LPLVYFRDIRESQVVPIVIFVRGYSALYAPVLVYTLLMDRYIRQKVIGMEHSILLLSHLFLKCSGRGSFGAAVLVKHKGNGKLYVMKEVNLSQLSKKDREESINEIRILSKLRSFYYFVDLLGVFFSLVLGTQTSFPIGNHLLKKACCVF
jgi:hypothetical protein